MLTGKTEKSFNDYGEAVRSLEKREFFGIKLGLENIKRLCELLDNPHEKYQVIHIAGTNGKGSVAAMCSSILHASGMKTGLYTSPHLQTIRERIQVNGSLISQRDFAEAFCRVKEASDIMKKNGMIVTYFEFTTAMAFFHFKEVGCDAAVIETGMGGRLDATNVVNSKISVITSIDLEHCQHLGRTKEKVAFEKSGIIKEGNVVVVGESDETLQNQFADTCKKKRAKLILAEKKYGDEIGLLGEHQRKNASMAASACLSFGTDKAAVRKGIANVKWPGRLEVIQKNPKVILDGAHNPGAVRSIANYLAGLDREITLVLGISDDKESKEMISAISPVAKKIILTSAAYRGKDCGQLLEEMKHFKGRIETVSDVKNAVKKAIKDSAEELIVVTGSLFVVGEARGLWFPDEP